MKALLKNSDLKQLFFLVIILGLGYLILKELVFFIPSFLGALTLYILTQKFYDYLIKIKKVKQWVAQIIVLLISFLVISIPIYIFTNLVINKVGSFMIYLDTVNESLKFISEYLKTHFGIDILDKDVLTNFSGFIGSYLKTFINSGVQTMTTIGFSFFIFYFMLSNSSWIENILYQWVPLKKENIIIFRNRFYKMVVSNAIGIPIVAIAQGITGLIGYSIIGINDIWFWFIVTIFTSAIPIVGSALAYVPIAIIYLANGQYYEGAFILAWGTIVIGSIDNICRFTLLKQLDDVHPLITVFGIIVGLNLFGFLGLIFGPLLISMLFVLMNLYRKEYPN